MSRHGLHTSSPHWKRRFEGEVAYMFDRMIFIFIPFSVKKERGLSKLKVVNYGITY